MSGIVAITGRPNVGKSTLFNRLIGRRQAITDNESGVTRDRHYGDVEWSGRQFSVIDTGGYVEGSDDPFEAAVRKQVVLALEESDAVIFMVDTVAGLTGLDSDFANIIRRSKKPVFLVANKADNTERSQMIGEFFSLGLGEVYPVSAQSGSGTGELLDDLINALPPANEHRPKDKIPRISVLGRPNAGKSTFINTLLGKDRNIVTDIAGTTRDSVDSLFNAFDKEFILTDTAGVRKKSKAKENIEFYSVLRAIRALESSDVCIILIDAERGVEAQDLNLISSAIQKNKGVVLLINKWDLIEKSTLTARDYEKKIKERLGTADFIPVVFGSALTKQRILKVSETAIEVYENKNRKIPTSKINDKLLKEIERNPPPAIKGKYIRIKYITQLPGEGPIFAFFCNLPQYIKEPYKRFLENRIRDHFGFEGVPVRLFFRKK